MVRLRCLGYCDPSGLGFMGHGPCFGGFGKLTRGLNNSKGAWGYSLPSICMDHHGEIILITAGADELQSKLLLRPPLINPRIVPYITPFRSSGPQP